MFKKTLAMVLCVIMAVSFMAIGASAEDVEIPAAPTGLTMAYGTTLADVKLNNGLVWTSDVAIARYKLGDNTFYAAYDYNNDGVYEAENIAVTVNVFCADHSWGDFKADGNAELFKDGTKTRTCKICGTTETVADENSAKAVATILDFVKSGKISSGLAKVIDVLVELVNKLISLAAGALSKV